MLFVAHVLHWLITSRVQTLALTYTLDLWLSWGPAKDTADPARAIW